MARSIRKRKPQPPAIDINALSNAAKAISAAPDMKSLGGVIRGIASTGVDLPTIARSMFGDPDDEDYPGLRVPDDDFC